MSLGATKKKRVMLAAAMLAVGLTVQLSGGSGIASSALFISAWLIGGLDVLIQAADNLRNSFLMGEHFLMGVATIGALLIGEHLEGAMVIVLYQIGELLEDRAVERSRASVAELMNIAPAIAYRLDGEVRQAIDPEEIEIGDVLEIRAGEKIPVDGVILSGESLLDASALTGESAPIRASSGTRVYSGALNGEGLLRMRAEKSAENSTAMRIMALLEEATDNSAETERMITRFARIYTPIVVALAVLVTLIPPLVWPGEQLNTWLLRGLTFLVVSCPCAFVVSVPMAFVAGLGVSSNLGILVKGGNVFERLQRINAIGFDKTGTLTRGEMTVTGIQPAEGVSERELLGLLEALERGSNHPIARAVSHAAASKGIRAVSMDIVSSVPGRGLIGMHDGMRYLFGNTAMMTENGMPTQLLPTGDLHLARGNESDALQWMGTISIADELKPDAAEQVRVLKKWGILRAVMLTGDRADVAEQIAGAVGISEYYAQLLPQDKLAYVKAAAGDGLTHMAFVGDGLNDAPVIAASEVGIAMGGIGSDAAIEAADVVLMKDDLGALNRLFAISDFTVRIAKQNIVLSLGIKLVFLIISTLGLTQMWMAVFADVGVTLLAVANGFRIFTLPRRLLGR